MSITARFNAEKHTYEILMDDTPVAFLHDGYIHGELDVSPYRREKFRRGAEIAFTKAFEGVALSNLQADVDRFSRMPSETSTAKSKTTRALQTLGYIPNGDSVKVPFTHPDILGNG